MKQEFSPYFVIYMNLSLGFVTWICLNLNWLLAVTGVIHEADDAYSIRSTWSCYWLDQFLTLALNILILSIFYISVDLSTSYFAHFSGCWASFVCSCHSIPECCVTFSGVKLSIRLFVLFIISSDSHKQLQLGIQCWERRYWRWPLRAFRNSIWKAWGNWLPWSLPQR